MENLLKRSWHFMTKTKVLFMDENKFCELYNDISKDVRGELEKEYEGRVKSLRDKVFSIQSEYRNLEEKYIEIEKQHEIYKTIISEVEKQHENYKAKTIELEKQNQLYKDTIIELQGELQKGKETILTTEFIDEIKKRVVKTKKQEASKEK